MPSFEYEISEADGFFWAVVYRRDDKAVLRFHLRRRADTREAAEAIGDEAMEVLAAKSEASEL